MRDQKIAPLHYRYSGARYRKYLHPQPEERLVMRLNAACGAARSQSSSVSPATSMICSKLSNVKRAGDRGWHNQLFLWIGFDNCTSSAAAVAPTHPQEFPHDSGQQTTRHQQIEPTFDVRTADKGSSYQHRQGQASDQPMPSAIVVLVHLDRVHGRQIDPLDEAIGLL